MNPMGLIPQIGIKIGILSKTIIERTTDLLQNMQRRAEMDALMERLEISHFSKFTQNYLGSVLILQFIYSFAFPLSAYSSFSGVIVMKVIVQHQFGKGFLTKRSEIDKFIKHFSVVLSIND